MSIENQSCGNSRIHYLFIIKVPDETDWWTIIIIIISFHTPTNFEKHNTTKYQHLLGGLAAAAILEPRDAYRSNHPETQ